MNSTTMQTRSEQISLEACQWLVHLQAASADGFPSEEERNQAFFDWLTSSANHLKVFIETFEAYQLLGTLNPKRSQEIRGLLGSRAEVIQLYGRAQQSSSLHIADVRTPAAKARKKTQVFAAAAVIAITAASSLLAWLLYTSTTYTTAIGEQRIFNLDDGSVIVLNTDSRVKVDFSDSQRSITLLQGEALFTVEQDARRPFIVSTGTASIQALGTQFNVRRRHDETEVSVVEGTVQVDAHGAPLTAARLVAGEEAEVQSGLVAKRSNPDVANTLAWRTRRLVFTNASFDEVAAEFNRYNRAQVRVEGAATHRKLTGIFDADRPRAFVLYAMRDLSLSVETEGDGWVIQSR